MSASICAHVMFVWMVHGVGNAAMSLTRLKPDAAPQPPSYTAQLLPPRSPPAAMLPLVAAPTPELTTPPVPTTTSSAASQPSNGAAANTAPPPPSYHPSAALTQPPRPLSDIEPEYPANDNFQEGTVVLRILINASGRVDDVTVERAFPKGIFERAALDAFRKATFAPGKLFGVAVNSQMLIEVKFTPYNRGGMVNGRLN